MTTTLSPGKRTLVLLTTLYLLFELAFNARLLDVAGGAPDTAALEGVEFFGRLLSGVGASLLLWKLIAPRVGPVGLRRLIFVCLLTIPAVYMGQLALVNTLVDNSDGEQRKRAELVTTLRWAAQKSAVEFPGLSIDEAGKTSPAGKTLFAVFPALFYSADKVQDSVVKQLDAVVTAAVRAQVGTASQTFNDSYIPLTNELRRLYNDQYVPASNKYSDASSQAPSPDDAWNEYLSSVESRGINPYNPSERQRSGVVKQLHKRGVKVPEHFSLDDEATFKASLPGAQGSFSAAASRALGFNTALQPGLSWAQFAAHKDVQALAVKRMEKRHPGLSLKGPLDLNASESEFARRVYEPLVSDYAKKRVQSLTEKAEKYITDPATSQRGRDAIRSLIVPPLALGFSLFFGLLNLVGLLAGLVPTNTGKVLARLTLTGAIVALPFVNSNTITASPAYAILDRELASASRIQAAGLRWLLGAEPMAYPVMNGVRVYVLQDFKFQKP